MIRQNRISLIFPIIGFLFCLAYVTMPYWITYTHTPPGQIWVPVNDQYHYCSDDKVYMPIVQRVREDFFHFRNPVSREIGSYWVDIFKGSSARAAALMSLFIPDERAALPVSFVLSVLINFLSIYFLASRGFSLSRSQATAASLTGIFWTHLFLAHHGWENIREYLLNVHGNSWFDLVNDHFRYEIMSVCISFAWWILLFLMKLKEDNSAIYTVIFSFFLACFAYSYPPMVFSVSLIFLFFGMILLFETRFIELRRLLLVGVGGILITLGFGIISHLQNIFSQSMSLALETHLPKATTTLVATDWMQIFWNRYFLIPFTIALIGKFDRSLVRVAFATALTSAVIKFLAIHPSMGALGDRLISRGYGSVWVVMSLIMGIRAARFYLPLKFHWAASFTLILLIGMGPLFGSIRMAEALTQSQSFYISKEQWETYRYIKSHLNRDATVFAFDLSDTQLLPVYTSTLLFTPGVGFGSSKPEVELDRFIQGWKLIGADHKIIAGWFNHYLDDYRRFKCAPASPRPSWEEMEGSQTISQLTYFPYVQSIAGVRIIDDPGGNLTPAFRAALNKTLDRPLDRRAILNQVDFILLSKRYELRRKLPFSEIDGFQRVFKNEWHTLYKRMR